MIGKTHCRYGNPQVVVDYNKSSEWARFSLMVGSFQDEKEGNFPALLLEGGESRSVYLTDNRQYPYVSLASIAVNTNDCIALSAFADDRRLEHRLSFTVPGYDTGTEE